MTQFRLVSDTHMELTRKNNLRLPSLSTDKETVLILAGDIGTWKQATSWMIAIKEQFAHIVYVVGNHEYYGQEMGMLINNIRERLNQHDNLHFLENNSLALDDCLLVGASLWTDMNNNDPQAIAVCGKHMNDYHNIMIGSVEVKRRLTPQDTISIHRESLKYFEQVIESATQPVIIVTHHAPTIGKVTDEDIGSFDDRIQYAYASDLYHWLNQRNDKVVAWCHGHTHKSMIYRLADVPVFTNAKGYADEKTGFKPEFVFSVSGSTVSYNHKELGW